MDHIVVFASGSGTNFQSVIDAVNSGRIPAEIAGLVTDRESIKAIARARAEGIPVRVIPPDTFEGEGDFAGALLEVLEAWEPGLIVLAGYLRKVPPPVVRRYEGKIINIHPALLPSYGGEGFYGMRVHQAVIEAGDSQSGCTVHRVTEAYDEGPILEQVTVPVRPGDTPESLAERVLEQEHKLLPRVIRRLLREESGTQEGAGTEPGPKSEFQSET